MIPRMTRVAEARPVEHDAKPHAKAFAETFEHAKKHEDDEDGRRMRHAPAAHAVVQETRPADRTSVGRRPADRLALLGHGEVAPKMAKVAPKVATAVVHEAFKKAIEAVVSHPAAPKPMATPVAARPTVTPPAEAPKKTPKAAPETVQTVLASAERVSTSVPAPVPVKVAAPSEIKAVVEQIMQHLDATQLRSATQDVRLTVNLGALGDVAVRVEAARGTGPLRVVLQASDPSTVAMLKDGIATLVDALGQKGYVAPVVEVKEGAASGELHEEKHGERGFARWEAAADQEAVAAAMGRRVRDGHISVMA